MIGFVIFDKEQNREINFLELEQIVKNNEWIDPRCKFEDLALGSEGSLYLLDAYGNWEYAPGRFEVLCDEEDQ